MESTKFCTLLLCSVMIVGLLALSLAFSSFTDSFIVNNKGQISTSSITAQSGSPTDIQTAVNTLGAVGGGTVYIPAGNFTFNPPFNGKGVTIPPGVNVIGAGVGITVLRETVNAGSGVIFYSTGQVNSGPTQGNPVRISGISFVGFVVNESVTANVGVSFVCAKDFRIDHCSFQDFAASAISTSANTGGTYPLIARGVIDHCSIDNPYKDRFLPHNSTASQPWALWGYGITVVGDYYTWDPAISDYLGQYYPTTLYNYTLSGHNISVPTPQPIYIENCNFSRCRHAIASNGAGYYVTRYNYFEKSSPYGQCDVHGAASGGGRALESYGNVFNFTDESYSFGQDAAVEPRGGGGVVWNNTVILSVTGTDTVQFGNDGESAPYDVESFYIWNNTAVWTNGTPVDFNSRISNSPGYIENTNYFLRAPNQTLDGFIYIPYTYPHPLTFGP